MCYLISPSVNNFSACETRWYNNYYHVHYYFSMITTFLSAVENSFSVLLIMALIAL